jgi:hypothetical protein
MHVRECSPGCHAHGHSTFVAVPLSLSRPVTRARLLLLHDGIECGGVMWTPVLAQFVQRNRVVVPDIPLNT